MTEDFTTEACLYLLDELDATRRAAFAAHLARDPVARAAFKTCADAYAEFARRAAPAEAMAPEAQHAMRAALLAQVADEAAARRARVQRAQARRWRYLWPMAAAGLLALNALQYWRSRQAGQAAELERKAAVAAALAELEGGSAGGMIAAADGKTPASPGAGQAAPPAGSASVKAELRRLEKLRTDYATLQRQRDALGAEYDAIIRQLAQRALVEQGVSRIAAMELVDNASYARGDRKGLVNLAKRFLTEPGIVAVDPGTTPPKTGTTPPTTTPQQEPQAPAPNLSSVPEGQTAGTITITPGQGISATFNSATGQPPQTQAQPPPAQPQTQPPAQPQTEPQNQPQPQSQPQTNSTSGDSAATQPYAWSVFDEAERQGYLNLYNLPTVAADQSLQLWVKPAGATEYQRVGEVPAQFYGGSGSLYYKLPDATATPAEILVTRESRKTPPAQPTGATVLRGP